MGVGWLLQDEAFCAILDAEPPVSSCSTNFSHSLVEVVRTDLTELVVGDLRIVQSIGGELSNQRSPELAHPDELQVLWISKRSLSW